MDEKDDKKVRSAKLVIQTAVILRLVWNALLAVGMAVGYSGTSDNLLRIYYGSTDLPKLIIGLFLDTALAVLWQYKPLFRNIHLIIYIVLGWIYYGNYLIDTLNLNGMAAVAIFITILPLFCIIGLIPFIVCGIGYRKLKKAVADQTET